MEITTQKFKKDLPKHLANEKVRKNIKKATWMTLEKRAKTKLEFPQWEEWRQELHNIKKNIINNLEENLNRFSQNAEQNGIKVLRAANAHEANKAILNIIENHKGKTIVKSKSMVTEELGLNHYLEKRNLEVLETDLGEFIIQLAHENPSHLIGPAVHKNAEEIAQLFHDKLGVRNEPVPEYLTREARKYLRKKFLTADIGITGANFGLIEDGGIVLVENEGNARLCYSLPNVHIVVMGIEKLIHNISDLDKFAPMLSVSGNGQKMTGYISVVKGPGQHEEIDGPEHMYVVLVDNGRMNLWKDEKLREALYCIRCSACYNTCPVYRNIGGHAYGWVYQGPIGAVITPHMVGLKKAADLPYASSLCGSCTDICPVKIPLHHLLLHNRNLIVKKKFSFSPEAFMFKGFSIMMNSVFLYTLSNKLLKFAVWVSRGKIKVPGWSKSREFPLPAKKSFKQMMKEMQ